MEAVTPWAQVTFAPPDPWVQEEAYDDKVAAKEGAHATYLLWVRQADAEAGKTFHATAVRLETALAVQNESQWRLNLDPRFQHLTLHWLRVVRNNERVDHLRRDRMRLIQRETQLEHHMINGSWTLLVVLNDVRPGDIIESGYSYMSRHPINLGWSETFFTVPAQFVVGRYRVSVLFDSARPAMDWKASPDAPDRVETPVDGGRTRWAWEGSQTALRTPEINQPTSFLDYTWIQVSDIAGWKPLAMRIADAWARADDGTPLDAVAEFARPAVLDAAAVRTLVRRIQDEFRYLSIDLDTGGWIPAAPGVVAGQRRGDCKDLVWLASAVLGRWGVRARPILVGTGLRERVSSLLPMTMLFNHAVLEVEMAGMTRWFDLTLRSQGGSFSSQPVGWFGFGLPVDAGAAALQAQPEPSSPNLYALRETIDLDTRRGKPSAVELRLWAEGFQAENLRRTRLAQGAEGFSNERLKQAQRRFGKAQRIGSLEWRDDRERNVCELAEAFEITDVVYPGEGGLRATYDVPLNTVVQFFAVPEDKPRRGPWNMPFPLEIRHLITARSKAMGANKLRRRKWSAPEFTAMLDEPRLSGEWTKAARFIVNAREIGAGRMAEYRQQLSDYFKATTWRLYLSWDQPRAQLEAGFGKLPPAERGVAAYVSSDDPRQYPEAKVGTDGPSPGKVWVTENWRRRMSRLGIRGQTLVAIWLMIICVMALAKGCN